MENKLKADPELFAKLELQSDDFRKFAYETHPDSYCESGWKDLPKSDKDKIIEAVDRRDLYVSQQGRETGAKLVQQCGDSEDSIPEREHWPDGILKTLKSFFDWIISWLYR